MTTADTTNKLLVAQLVRSGVLAASIAKYLGMDKSQFSRSYPVRLLKFKKDNASRR